MKIPVQVTADDPVSENGIKSLLRGRPEVVVVDDLALEEGGVSVVAFDEFDEFGLQRIRALRGSCLGRCVLVIRHLDDNAVLLAAEAGVTAMLRRSDSSPERLTTTIVSAARGEGTVPPDLLGRLLAQVGNLQRNVLAPQGLTFSGLTEREVEVLRLVADGRDTAEIARRLSYSERTVKNVLHDLTTRLQLRNRSHAVAYAVRNGLI